MKKAFKVFGYLLIILLVLLIALAVTASFSQNKIVDLALKEISKNLDATVEVDEVSFTLLKKFPYATLEFSGIKVGASKNYTPANMAFNQTIAYINRAFISVKSKPLLDGKFEIIRVDMEGADVFYYTDSLGKTNVDFLTRSEPTSKTDTSSSSIPVVDLSAFEIKNLSITYINDSLGATANIYIPELELEGKISTDELAIQTEGKLQLSDCSLDSTSIHQLKLLNVEFNLAYNEENLTVERLQIESDGLTLDTEGTVVIDSPMLANLNLKSAQINLEEILKYIPPKMVMEYGLVDLNGKLSLSGEISGALLDSVLPAINLDFNLEDGQLFTDDYPGLEQIKFTGNYSNGELRNNSTTKVNFETFWVKTKSSNAKASFSFQNLDKPEYVMHSQMNLSLKEFNPWIPDSIAKSVSGDLQATFSTHGTLPDSIDDAFINSVLDKSKLNLNLNEIALQYDTLDISGLSGKLNYKPGNINVDGFSINLPNEKIALKNSSFIADLEGTLTELNNVGINLHQLHVESPQGTLHASGSIKEINHPEFKINGDLQLKLSELKPFISDTLLSDLSGNITLKVQTQGKIHPDSLANQMMDIIFKQTQLTLALEGFSAVLPDTLTQISSLSGSVSMVPDTVSFHKFSGEVLGVPLKIDSTSIINAYNTLIQNRQDTFLVVGNIALGDIDHRIFDALPSLPPVEENTMLVEDSITTEATNYTYNLKGKFSINSFTYDHAFINKMANYLALDDSTTQLLNSYLRDEILIDNISTKFNIKDSLSILEDFNLHAFGGALNTNVRYRLYTDSIERINMRNVADKLDLKKLLYECNSFGQEEVISYKNIKGLLSSDVYTLIYLEKGNFISENTRIKGDLRLENGGVFDYKPAMEMSKVPGLKDLENIQFKTLESNIFMFKNNFYVPKTYIISSVMDITAFGMQSQTEEYEYHLQFPLGDVLTGKSKKLLAKQAERGEDVSKADLERNTFNLIYAHIDGNKRVGKVGEKAIEAMRVKIKTQQEILDFIFKPELISFDSGIK